MKKLVILPFLLIIFFAFVGYWFYENAKAPSTLTSYQNFNIASGTSAGQIGENLYKKSLIKSPVAFKIYVQFSGISGRIQSGDYRLSPNLNLFQVVDTLSKAPLEIRVTIPEGLRREEVALKFAKGLDAGNSFVPQFLEVSAGKEGYLFPDTYLLSNNATPGAIVSKMTSNFANRVDALIPAESKLSSAELLVLASLVERETREGEERPIVAGILLNRLEAGWPLQVDATIQYAVASSRCKSNILGCAWWEPISSSELAPTSPYNTYKNPGLPPGPIANPGLSAIKAAYNPVKTDYFFYIHDRDGKIHYAKTLDEQNANINAYLR